MNKILEDITVRYYAIIRDKNLQKDIRPFVFMYNNEYYFVNNFLGLWQEPFKIDFFDLSKPLEK